MIFLIAKCITLVNVLIRRAMDNLEFDDAETLTCLALAELWDDPDNNNFDCPWDWRKELTNNE